jgi:hypothetical protein
VDCSGLFENWIAVRLFVVKIKQNNNLRLIGHGLKPNLKIVEPFPKLEHEPDGLERILDHPGVCCF